MSKNSPPDNTEKTNPPRPLTPEELATGLNLTAYRLTKKGLDKLDNYLETCEKQNKHYRPGKGLSIEGFPTERTWVDDLDQKVKETAPKIANKIAENKLVQRIILGGDKNETRER